MAKHMWILDDKGRRDDWPKGRVHPSHLQEVPRGRIKIELPIDKTSMS